MKEKLLIIGAIITTAALVFGVIRHYQVKRFRRNCKRFDICHFFIDEMRCMGRITTIDRSRNRVTIEILDKSIGIFNFNTDVVCEKFVFRSFGDIYP